MDPMRVQLRPLSSERHIAPAPHGLQDICNMADEQVPIEFIDNPHAPEIFVSGISGLFMSGENVVITFESARVNHSKSPGPVNRVVIARAALTVPAAQALVLGLNAFLEQNSLSPSEAMKGGRAAH
jgi:hypothetical protein